MVSFRFAGASSTIRTGSLVMGLLRSPLVDERRGFVPRPCKRSGASRGLDGELDAWQNSTVGGAFTDGSRLAGGRRCSGVEAKVGIKAHYILRRHAGAGVLDLEAQCIHALGL